MKKIILKKILSILARAAIRKYKPKVIGITGSVGKTSTKEAVFAMLKNKFKVRAADKNYNNEIGLPLTILGISHGGSNIFAWLAGLVQAIGRVYFYRTEYPEILILEYGIDHPGDMDYLLSIAVPHIGVVTAVGDMPVHVEFFKNTQELILEKKKLVQALSVNDYALLNHDDHSACDMRDATKARVLTFGFEESAEIRIINYNFHSLRDQLGSEVPEGISFKIEHAGHVVPFRIHGGFGEAQAYAAAAASAAGILLHMNLVDISEAIANYYFPLPGRMRLLKGIKESMILDDTYNASPLAMRAALDTLKELPGKRKIAILGDMLELGKYTEAAHRSIGDLASKFVDVLITVGSRSKFILDEVNISARKKQIQAFSFEDAISAGLALDPMIKAGDLVLVKGSQTMRMERAVEEIMAEPEKAENILVRQEKYWKMN